MAKRTHLWITPLTLAVIACGDRSTDNASSDTSPGRSEAATTANTDRDPLTDDLGATGSIGSTDTPDTRPVDERPPDISYGGQATTTTIIITTTTTTTVAPTTTTTIAPTTTTIPPTTSAPTTTIATEVAVELSNDASFESSSAALTETGKTQLDELLAQLDGVTVTSLDLHAWSDTRGSKAANLTLATGRNASVLDYLIDARPDLVGVAHPVAHGEADPPTPCTGDCPANRIVIITATGTR